MGCYINPRNMSKEEWLKLNAIQTDKPASISETHVPICLVDNGPFTAAGVGFSQDEIDAFFYPDNRTKYWFTATRELVRQVSDLANWEKERGRTR